jgi:hypothetical protein
MPSNPHQRLLTWLARKMTFDGYVIGGFDGPAPQGFVWNALPLPFEIRGVRPDLWGINVITGAIAVGEAKTSDDVDTRHTRKQLRVYSRLRRRLGAAICRVYFAVPRSTVYALDRVLSDVQALGAAHVIRLHVPDCLLGDEDRVHA